MRLTTVFRGMLGGTVAQGCGWLVLPKVPRVGDSGLPHSSNASALFDFNTIDEPAEILSALSVFFSQVTNTFVLLRQ